MSAKVTINIAKYSVVLVTIQNYKGKGMYKA